MAGKRRSTWVSSIIGKSEEEKAEEKKKKSQVTWHHVFAIFIVAGGGGFQHGYNTGVINAPQKLLEEFLREESIERHGKPMEDHDIGSLIATMVAIYCLGGMIGGGMSAYVADRMGRKWGLLWNNVFVIVGALLESFSKPTRMYEMFIFGRFAVGVNSGLNAALAPMYLTEISPLYLRGAIGSLYQLTITITILLSQILGLPVVLGTKEHWPILFGVALIPGILMMVPLFFCPESPKYLLNNDKDEEAKKALQWFLNTDDVESDFTDLKVEIEESWNLPKVGIKDMWIDETHRKAIIISGMMMIAQQFSGINAVIYYSTEIFRMAGLKNKAVYYTFVMGVVNVATTVVAVALVEKAGRRTLFLLGMGGMSILSLVLTLSLSLQKVGHFMETISILSVFFFIIMFAIGPGPIPWFIVSELFTQNIRSLATSIATCINWFANFIVAISFVPIMQGLKSYCFLIFMVLEILFCIFTYFMVPETKGKTILEIQEGLKKN